MRILGLDMGTVRIGIALSDEMGWTAQPLTVLKHTDDDADLAAISELVREHNVTEVVIGLPRNMNGSEGPMAQKVLAFAARLRTETGLTVHEWDERLSTSAAERMLVEVDLSRKKRKAVIDKVAAAYILQGFLDSRGGGF
jgi:putative Holliday junction resolvase